MGCPYAKRFFLLFDVRDIYIDMSFNITSNIVFEITPFINMALSICKKVLLAGEVLFGIQRT